MNKEKKTILWKIISYVSVFIITALLLFGMLVLSAKIPKASLKKHMLESAEMLCERDTYFRVIPGVDSSTLHRTADAVLLSIAWQFDENNPVESVLWSSLYRYGETEENNNNLLDSIKYGYEPNIQYLRYWHGSALVVRLFHLIGSLRQMYISGAILMAEGRISGRIVSSIGRSNNDSGVVHAILSGVLLDDTSDACLSDCSGYYDEKREREPDSVSVLMYGSHNELSGLFDNGNPDIYSTCAFIHVDPAP